MQRGGGAAGDEGFEACPTYVIRATPARVWELLTDPARFDWVGVKVIEAPARSLPDVLEAHRRGPSHEPRGHRGEIQPDP